MGIVRAMRQDEPPWQHAIAEAEQAWVGKDAFIAAWYAARECGEKLSGQVLAQLHQFPSRIPSPGGAGSMYPDPRAGRHFSMQRQIQTLCALWGIELLQTSDPRDIQAAEEALPKVRGIRWCWLYIMDGPQFTIVHRSIEPGRAEAYNGLCFDLAQLLGDIAFNSAFLASPYAPTGYYAPHNARGHVTCLHQFARAFLGLEFPCPPAWSCDCVDLRERLNRAPPEHSQRTDAWAIADVERMFARRQKIMPMSPDEWEMKHPTTKHGPIIPDIGLMPTARLNQEQVTPIVNPRRRNPSRTLAPEVHPLHKDEAKDEQNGTGGTEK